MGSLDSNKKLNEQGSIIVSILIVSIFLSTFVFGLIVLANSNLTRSRNRIFLLQSQYAAESGADAAIAMLNAGDDSYAGTPSEVTLLNTATHTSRYTTSVVQGVDSRERIVTATGHVYVPANSPTPTFSRTIEVTVKRSNATTGSSMLSRNIVDMESGVKNVRAKDIYVNGYIRMNKNTTNLIAENITVADKNTDAANCSIGGSGNLVKPSSFTDPAQTSTNIRMAFNNCITPPGNTSNADFNVLANQTNVGKIQSTVIPWSYAMDSSYTNSSNDCTDWTSGVSPRQIPSAGNNKRTHYPDNASGISSNCGTSGNIDLGNNTYNILDHAHIRANLCDTSGCAPTFNNPDTGAAGIKFIFIEGTVNFNRVMTSAGSGPIVIVTYGTDPASKASVCPLGGAIYLGQDGGNNVIAPALYLLANNGICLDKTRFGASPALGGLSGKNLFIATNPGTPFDLTLDPLFPSEEIPVDLSWRAVRFRRL